MKTILLVCAIAAILVVGWLSWGVHRNRRIEKVFEQLPAGATDSQLNARLGKPWKSARCGETFGGTMPEGCSRELIYASAFAPVDPTYWAFFADSGGRLLDRYKYMSP